MNKTTILIGDCRKRLAELPDKSVHCIVTSPPYWGLRSYQGGEDMIGLEPTWQEHLDNLMQVFDECWRVLRDDGTLWLNYGDAYVSNPGNSADRKDWSKSKISGGSRGSHVNYKKKTIGTNWKPKDLMMMPARVAIEMQERGWYLRSEIVWAKRDPMPESVTDRPTSAHEKVFLLTKKPKYFYDHVAVRVASESLNGPATWKRQRVAAPSDSRKHGHAPVVPKSDKSEQQAPGANLRNVWSITKAPYKGAHFATFPTKLVEPCIKAGTSEHGVCADCGAPHERETDKKLSFESGSGKSGRIPKGKHEGGQQQTSGTYDPRMGPVVRHTTTGWQPSCKCNGEIKPGVVLDPFGGSGTVGVVAGRLGRDSIIIEISEEYAEIAEKRIVDDCPMLNQVEVK